MSSGIIYNSAMLDEASGAIDYDTDTFYVMLVGDSYTADKKLDTRRDDVTGEVVGEGYASGGQAVNVTVTADNAFDRVIIELGGAVWPASTITAYGAVYYKRRGGDPSDDELVYFNDFEQAVSSTDGTFTLNPSTIRKQS